MMGPEVSGWRDVRRPPRLPLAATSGRPSRPAPPAYVFEGEVSFGDASDPRHRAVAATRLAVLGDGDLVRAHTGEKPGRFLLLSGKPLREPVARYGPFVMNTPEENPADPPRAAGRELHPPLRRRSSRMRRSSSTGAGFARCASNPASAALALSSG